MAIATACLVSDSPVPRRSRRVGWGSGARIHVGCPPADPPIAASFARRPSDCPAMGRQASGAIFRLGDIRTRRRATGCDWGIYVDAHHGRRKYRLRCFSSLLLVATMRLSLFTPNKSAQPMPGERLGFNRHHLARHGWPQRSADYPMRLFRWTIAPWSRSISSSRAAFSQMAIFWPLPSDAFLHAPIAHVSSFHRSDPRSGFSTRETTLRPPNKRVELTSTAHSGCCMVACISFTFGCSAVAVAHPQRSA